MPKKKSAASQSNTKTKKKAVMQKAKADAKARLLRRRRHLWRPPFHERVAMATSDNMRDLLGAQNVREILSSRAPGMTLAPEELVQVARAFALVQIRQEDATRAPRTFWKIEDLAWTHYQLLFWTRLEEVVEGILQMKDCETEERARERAIFFASLTTPAEGAFAYAAKVADEIENYAAIDRRAGQTAGADSVSDTEPPTPAPTDDGADA